MKLVILSLIVTMLIFGAYSYGFYRGLERGGSVLLEALNEFMDKLIEKKQKEE